MALNYNSERKNKQKSNLSLSYCQTTSITNTLNFGSALCYYPKNNESLKFGSRMNLGNHPLHHFSFPSCQLTSQMKKMTRKLKLLVQEPRKRKCSGLSLSHVQNILSLGAMCPKPALSSWLVKFRNCSNVCSSFILTI